MVHAQGGYNRADRNYAAWVYENLLAGTDVDLSKFYGYKNLHALHGGVKNDRGSAKKTFKHKLGIAAGVAHDGARMWSSDVGRKALLE